MESPFRFSEKMRKCRFDTVGTLRTRSGDRQASRRASSGKDPTAFRVTTDKITSRSRFVALFTLFRCRGLALLLARFAFGVLSLTAGVPLPQHQDISEIVI